MPPIVSPRVITKAITQSKLSLGNTRRIILSAEMYKEDFMENAADYILNQENHDSLKKLEGSDPSEKQVMLYFKYRQYDKLREFLVKNSDKVNNSFLRKLDMIIENEMYSEDVLEDDTSLKDFKDSIDADADELEYESEGEGDDDDASVEELSEVSAPISLGSSASTAPTAPTDMESSASTTSTTSIAPTAPTTVQKIKSFKINIAKPLQSSFSSGLIIHTLNRSLDKGKYKDTFLEASVNSKSCILMVDIKTCQDIIYPVTFRLYQDSTVNDVIDFAIRALVKASEIPAKCIGSSLHDYKIIQLDKRDRYIYMQLDPVKYS